MWRRISTASFVAAFGVFALITLASLVTLTLHLTTEALERSAHARVHHSGSVASDAIEMQIDQVGIAVDQASRRPIFSNPPSGSYAGYGAPGHRVQSELLGLRYSSAYVPGALLIDPKGVVVAGDPANAWIVGRDVSAFVPPAAFAVDTPRVGASFVAERTGNPLLIPVTKVVRGPSGGANSGEVLGLVVAVVEVRPTLESFAVAFAASNRAAVDIYDQTGNLLASSAPERALPGDSEPVRQALLRREAIVDRKVGGEEVISVYEPVGKTGLVVATSVPMKDAFAPIADLRERVIIAALLLGAILVFGFSALAVSMRAKARAESSLRATERRMRMIVDTAAQAFVEYDSRRIVTEWNAEAGRLLGWSPDEVRGRPIQDFVTFVPGQASTDRMLDFLYKDDSSASLRIEVVLNTKGGAVVPVEVTAWKTGEGSERRFEFFIADITERRRMEDERNLVLRRQRQLLDELRKADKAKSDFISTASHELRTPLTSIVGYLEMLHDGYGGELSGRQRSMLGVVERNSRRLLSLIEDMLTLSRIESGALRLGTSEVDVSTLAANVEQALLPAVRERGVDLSVDVDVNTGPVVGDSTQLERVLFNLVTNAIKFTPAGGSVSLSTWRDGENVAIAVSDTGIGIPLDEQDRLFTRFFRSSTAQEQAVQGTGLGLTIVKSIVDRHGGTIEVDSMPGRGTSVRVLLPAVTQRLPAFT